MRYLILSLVIALLSGCDPEVKPAKVEPPKGAAPAAPEPAVEQPQAAVEAAAPLLAAAPAKVVPVAPPAAAQPPAKPPQPPREAARAEPQPAPHAPLDLSLPPELLEQAAVQGAAGQATAPLLPPLFEEKTAADNPLQLSGRLITGEGDADYWESVEGAELQFELKR